jgi:hypothetical protein
MDLQFTQFNDALELTGAREIPDYYPRTLELTGVDLSNAIEVLINEISSPSFVIASKKVIYAEVPGALTRYVIRNISVLSSDFTATIRSRIRFRLGQDPQKATGLKAMMQTFLKILFTTSGTDAFAKKVGGSGLKNIGRNFDVGQSATIVSDFAISVRSAESQMRSLQAKQPRLDDDERLLSANLLNAKFDVNLTALIARVELIAQSGRMAIANLEL